LGDKTGGRPSGNASFGCFELPRLKAEEGALLAGVGHMDQRSTHPVRAPRRDQGEEGKV
jgi:hypothetical protein